MQNRFKTGFICLKTLRAMEKIYDEETLIRHWKKKKKKKKKPRDLEEIASKNGAHHLSR